jgi:hypothetical protein
MRVPSKVDTSTPNTTPTTRTSFLTSCTLLDYIVLLHMSPSGSLHLDTNLRVVLRALILHELWIQHRIAIVLNPENTNNNIHDNTIVIQDLTPTNNSILDNVLNCMNSQLKRNKNYATYNTQDWLDEIVTNIQYSYHLRDELIQQFRSKSQLMNNRFELQQELIQALRYVAFTPLHKLHFDTSDSTTIDPVEDEFEVISDHDLQMPILSNITHIQYSRLRILLGVALGDLNPQVKLLNLNQQEQQSTVQVAQQIFNADPILCSVRKLDNGRRNESVASAAAEIAVHVALGAIVGTLTFGNVTL